MSPPRLLALTGACLALCVPMLAQAYSGPGVGLGALSVVIGIVGSVFLMTLSLVWYPFKRMIRSLRRSSDRPAPLRDGKN